MCPSKTMQAMQWQWICRRGSTEVRTPARLQGSAWPPTPSPHRPPLAAGAYSCALELALEIHTTKYVNFVMQRVDMLLHLGVKPILVADGQLAPPPMKESTHRERLRKKLTQKELGLRLHKEAMLVGNDCS